MTEDKSVVGLQDRMDVDKWLESERQGRDMCGTYAYCSFCDKTEAYPCANAYMRMTARDEDERERAALAAADATEETTALGKTVDIEDVMRRKAARKSLSFAEKYALSDDIVKERYACLLYTSPSPRDA